MRVNPGDIGRNVIIVVDHYGEVTGSSAQSATVRLSTATDQVWLRMSPADVLATWRALGEVVQALELDD